MKNQLLVSIFIALGTLLTVAASSATASEAAGYVVDSRGSPLRSGTGLCWRTGYWTPAMATPECDPDLAGVKGIEKTVASIPKPASKVQMPAATPPKAEGFSLSADGLFAFGKSNLVADSQGKLELLATRLRTGNFSKITVTGHTDRLGSKQRNQKLSMQRAEAVKAFLVSKGVDSSRIVAVGKGSSEPKTTPGACKGRKGPKLIACLEADRRVEITATP